MFLRLNDAARPSGSSMRASASVRTRSCFESAGSADSAICFSTGSRLVGPCGTAASGGKGIACVCRTVFPKDHQLSVSAKLPTLARSSGGRCGNKPHHRIGRHVPLGDSAAAQMRGQPSIRFHRPAASSAWWAPAGALDKRRKRFQRAARISAGGKGMIAAEDHHRAPQVAHVLSSRACRISSSSAAGTFSSTMTDGAR